MLAFYSIHDRGEILESWGFLHLNKGHIPQRRRDNAKPDARWQSEPTGTISVTDFSWQRTKSKRKQQTEGNICPNAPGVLHALVRLVISSDHVAVLFAPRVNLEK